MFMTKRQLLRLMAEAENSQKGAQRDSDEWQQTKSKILSFTREQWLKALEGRKQARPVVIDQK